MHKIKNRFVNKSTEEIINIVKAKEKFGGFEVSRRYRDDNLRTRLKNIANKTRKLVIRFTSSGSFYFYNPYFYLCKNLDTISYKKFCKKLVTKFPNPETWSEEIVKNILLNQKGSSMNQIKVLVVHDKTNNQFFMEGVTVDFACYGTSIEDVKEKFVNLLKLNPQAFTKAGDKQLHYLDENVTQHTINVD